MTTLSFLTFCALRLLFISIQFMIFLCKTLKMIWVYNCNLNSELGFNRILVAIKLHTSNNLVEKLIWFASNVILQLVSIGIQKRSVSPSISFIHQHIAWNNRITTKYYLVPTKKKLLSIEDVTTRCTLKKPVSENRFHVTRNFNCLQQIG